MKGVISMGKPTSYLFGRYHDLKSTFFDENGDFQYVLISLSLPKYFETFVQNNPNYSQNNAVLALCSLSALDDSAEKVKYATYANQYGRDYGTIMDTIMGSYNELDKLLEQKPYDTSIIYLVVFCLGLRFPKNPESMNVACSLLNRVLDMEERNQVNVDDELMAWCVLAAFVDFESWHDRNYGSPIIGPSPFDGKDKYGNRIQNTNNTQSSNSRNYNNNTSTSRKSGGCYIATAVYGSYDCPQVWTLRRYRDNTLATKWYGRMFIRFYYATSPRLVKIFGNNSRVVSLCRKKLDKMVASLQGKGFSDSPYTDK